MSLINYLLDMAGLLLWVCWRAAPLDPLAGATPATLAGTVRRAGPPRWKRWYFLAVLPLLLVLRSVFYWQIGPAIGWTPRIDLGLVAPAFPSMHWLTCLLFSLLSFLRTWIVFHFWLTTLVLIHGRAAESNPFHKLVLLQLGRVGRWPRPVLALVPVLVTGLLWMAVHPLLAGAGVVRMAQSWTHLVEQALLVGGALWFTLKDFLPVILFLHLVASYVYLGASPLWEYIDATACRILRPLRRVPLRLGRVDFSPVLGILLILLLLQAGPSFLQFQLSRPPRNLLLWPQ